jgi:hypothetical protein
MPPKICFIHGLFFYTQLVSWILIRIVSPEREEERESTGTSRGNEGSSTRSSGRLDSIGGGCVSFLTSLTLKMNYSHSYMFHVLTSLTQKENFVHEP